MSLNAKLLRWCEVSPGTIHRLRCQGRNIRSSTPRGCSPVQKRDKKREKTAESPAPGHSSSHRPVMALSIPPRVLSPEGNPLPTPGSHRGTSGLTGPLTLEVFQASKGLSLPVPPTPRGHLTALVTRRREQEAVDSFLAPAPGILEQKAFHDPSVLIAGPWNPGSKWRQTCLLLCRGL